MTTQEANANPKSDFLAAEEIKGILKGREKPEQERIIRWVSESLGLSLRYPVAGADRAEAAGASPQGPAAAATLPAPVGEDAHPKDIRTFVGEKQPKSGVHFVAVVAYWHRFVASETERKETITPADLQTAGRLSNQGVFDRPHVTMNNSVQQGYVDRVGRGKYRLNAVGENLVAMTLPGTHDKQSGDGRPGKRRKGRPTGKPRAKNRQRAS